MAKLEGHPQSVINETHVVDPVDPVLQVGQGPIAVDVLVDVLVDYKLADSLTQSG